MPVTIDILAGAAQVGSVTGQDLDADILRRDVERHCGYSRYGVMKSERETR